MSQHQAFMQRAIDLSRREMLGTGAAPFAAVVVRDGEVVGEGVNHVVKNHDPTSHGEIEAIRDACTRLQTWDLSGCTLYTTCEPCEMCVAAMHWARIDRMFYACELSDVEALGFDLKPLTRLVRSDLKDRALPAEQILAAEGREVLTLWSQQPDFTVF